MEEGKKVREREGEKVKEGERKQEKVTKEYGQQMNHRMNWSNK